VYPERTEEYYENSRLVQSVFRPWAMRLKMPIKNIRSYLRIWPQIWMGMRSLLFWDVTQRWLVVSYRRFGTTYLSHLHGSSSPDRHLQRTDCLKTSVSKKQSKLCNMPEERRPHLHSGESRVCLLHRCPQMFQKYSSHLHIPGTRRVTWSISLQSSDKV
jgi:hypothetical protein